MVRPEPNMLHGIIFQIPVVVIYLKPSYFSGTLILAIFLRQGFSVFSFQRFY